MRTGPIRFSLPLSVKAFAKTRPSKTFFVENTRPGAVAIKAHASEHDVALDVLSNGLIAFLLFKSVMLTTLTPAIYQNALVTLSQGTLLEKFSAMVLTIDPITKLLSQMIQTVL